VYKRVEHLPQCEVIMPREDKNDNGKKKLVIHITGKKDIKLSKKKYKLERLQDSLERNS
jgi:biopolymer transport protein ExbD